MQKIISLFQRNYETDKLVRDEVVPGAEWVLAGEGVATQKHDGTCCLVRGTKLYKRYEVKPGKKPPANFEPANDVDEDTGKQQGWVPVGDGPEDEWHREAFERMIRTQDGRVMQAKWYFEQGDFDGTCELIGPKVQGNPEGKAEHWLVPHGYVTIDDAPRDYAGLKAFLSETDIEGIVWHHPDGRMVKIKGKDFGIKRKSFQSATPFNPLVQQPRSEERDMKLVLVSDLHGYLPPIPACDVLVIAGDICPVVDHTLTHQRRWLNSNFKRWLYSQPAKHVVATAGNHDWIFQKRPDLVPRLPWNVLIDESCEIDGVRFHGCPWQPEFCDWAFNAKPAHLKDIHEAIPPCDVLVSHGPPFGYCDKATRRGKHLGSVSLVGAIQRIQPRLVACGHIHGGYGVMPLGETDIVNASMVNEAYQLVNAPVEYEL